MDAFAHNMLLQQLGNGSRERIAASMKLVHIEIKQPLIESGERLTHVWFPTTGVISSVSVMQSGAQSEVAAVGREGMVSALAAVGTLTLPFKIMGQVPGDAWCLPVAKFHALMEDDRAFASVIRRYVRAYYVQVAQSAACNNVHSIEQRAARWVLMTRNRAGREEFELTHEILSHMLGVRRASVSEALAVLTERGAIEPRRGAICVLDEGKLRGMACECFDVIEEAYGAVHVTNGRAPVLGV